MPSTHGSRRPPTRSRDLHPGDELSVLRCHLGRLVLERCGSTSVGDEQLYTALAEREMELLRDRRAARRDL
jgi:hypothetical protein